MNNEGLIAALKTAMGHNDLAMLDGAVRSLVRKHGRQAVLDSVKRNTAKKRGRQAVDDWADAMKYLLADADDWIAGRNPEDRISSYKIAMQLSKQNKSDEKTASFQRIYDKLRPDRRKKYLTVAYLIGESDGPWQTGIDALNALTEMEGDQRYWAGTLRAAEQALETYTERLGPPAPESSLAFIKAKVAEGAWTLGRLAGPKPSGLFGISAILASPGDPTA